MIERTNTFLWAGEHIRFEPSDSIAAALDRAGIIDFGRGQGPCAARYFCGIGACQACVVSVDGVPAEACLTPAVAGSDVRQISVVGQ